jgi:thiol-disulfide isomerase/thioredoxin
MGSKVKKKPTPALNVLNLALKSWFGVYNFRMTNSMIKIAIWLGAAVLAVGVLTGCKKEPLNSAKKAEEVNSVISPKTPEPNAAVKPVAQPADAPKTTVRDIIAKRRGWDPIYPNWYGKEAPDFTLTDIKGVSHTLSEYRGKNVMLTFWATWCGPCIREIPHLIELRKTYSEDKLAILGITFIGPMNSAETVKKFVAKNPVINYTIISTDGEKIPKPYNEIDAIPTGFFIDRQGKFKLVTEGAITLTQMKQIIEAEQ